MTSDEPKPGGHKPPKGRLRRWTASLSTLKRFLLTLSSVLVALAAVVAGVVGVRTALVGSSSESAPIEDQHTPSSPPKDPPSTPTSTPTSETAQELRITVSCRMPPTVKPGDRFTATYAITSNRSMKVGLGAGIYDENADDYSNGDGDRDGYQIEARTQSATREVSISTSLPPGRYEIVAEVWPNGKIGAEDTEVLAEATCGSFTAP